MERQEHLDLLAKVYRIKKRFLGMYKAANAGHIGSSLSVAEILTFVRFGWMKESDEFILSKGHAAASLYAVLAEDGTLSEKDIATYYKNGTYLAAHPPVNKIKHIPFATGSLGHGLSLAAGFGIANRLKQTDKTIFCITSDGELNEGATWEAALFIAQHNLRNVVWLIDRNRLQGYGRTEEVMKLDSLANKISAFGFAVFTAEGHDFNSLAQARSKVEAATVPAAVICNTTKGRGWKLYEDKLDCHYLPMKDEYDLVLEEIKNDFEKRSAEVL